MTGSDRTINPADYAAVQPNTPVLVGAGQVTERSHQSDGKSPAGLIAESARLALQDALAGAGGEHTALYQPDALAMVRMVFDTRIDGSAGTAVYGNPPGAVAGRLGIAPARLFYSDGGGSSPQRMVNDIAAMIAAGELRSAVLAGGEALSTAHARHLEGLSGWPDGCDAGSFEDLGKLRAGATEEEIAHGLAAPIRTYPLFANALRRKYRQDTQQHLQACAALFSPLSARAQANPYAWFPQKRSEQELGTVDDSNRWVSTPYPKYLNAVMRVNMAASVVMMSWQEAGRLGIPPHRCAFLHGCSQAHEKWYLSERVDYASAPAIGANVSQALQMAGITTDDLSFMDIYSCFPCAVQIACDEIGIAHHDARGLTLTGGLPYFGGPGNNYAMHSIAETLLRLRRNPAQWGLVTANGWYLTKHGTGVYSGRPPAGQWRALDCDRVQRAVDAQHSPQTDPRFAGEVQVETYTVCYGRTGADRAVVIARTADGRRVFAGVPRENQALLQSMTEQEWLDRPGIIRRDSNHPLGVFEEKSV